MKAARDALRALDEILVKSGPDARLKLLADVGAVGFAGPRVQILMGRWFLRNRNRFARIAITNAGKLQTAIVGTIFRIAGIDRLRFFFDAEEAARWVEREGLLSAQTQPTSS